MKVYVLTIKECVDYDDTVMTRVYSSEEKAKKAFDDVLKEAKENAKKDGWKFDAKYNEFFSHPEGDTVSNYSHSYFAGIEVL